MLTVRLMRTTIEITAVQRAKLLEIAARRGEKGFSQLVQQALDAYLEAQSGEAEKRRRALRLKGTLGARDAASLRRAARELRDSWR